MGAVHARPLLPKVPPTHCDEEGGAGRASLQVDHGQQGRQLPLARPRVEQPAGGDSDIMVGGASGGGASQGDGPGEGAGKRKRVDPPCQGGSREREGGGGPLGNGNGRGLKDGVRFSGGGALGGRAWWVVGANKMAACSQGGPGKEERAGLWGGGGASTRGKAFRRRGFTG